MNVLPSASYKYFWDVKPDQIDLNVSRKFVIERLLEMGDMKELLWLQDQYSKDDLIDTVKTSRRISQKTGNFFALVFGIATEELECMKKPSIQTLI